MNYKKEKTSGILDLDYAHDRTIRTDLKYRLDRRAREVIRALEKFGCHPLNRIIDLGTAEGMGLSKIKKKFIGASCFGVEYNKRLLFYGKKRFHDLIFMSGDVQTLSIKNNSFDACIATAIIVNGVH